jgi:hypothetical protein
MGYNTSSLNAISEAVPTAWALPRLNNIGHDMKADLQNSSRVCLPARIVTLDRREPSLLRGILSEIKDAATLGAAKL